ncbi:MAG TPA: GDSL-type esterase/lipase family protein [Vicinamibacterales bacterium]
MNVTPRWTSRLIVAACVCLSACGGGPNGPTPLALTITCPANQSAESADGNPVAVSFNAPQSSGGNGTVTSTCTPTSGSQFPEGTSTVSCEARDGANRTASCSFSVRVQGPPRLIAARFLAFGDSLTAGVFSPAPSLLIVSPPGSYPFQLQDRLVARYRLQTPIVLNEGNPGELASGTGVQRFRSVLMANRPDIVLLMEGTNDLLVGAPGPDAAINALRAMVREAKGQNIRIALATIPPQRAGGLRNRDAVARIIPAFNGRIRELAAAETIPLIDVFAGMDGDNSLIGIDDLHMTMHGYDVMAGIYFDAIRTNFEVQPPAAALQWR